jgi:hypothetical protein
VIFLVANRTRFDRGATAHQILWQLDDTESARESLIGVFVALETTPEQVTPLTRLGPTSSRHGHRDNRCRVHISASALLLKDIRLVIFIFDAPPSRH